MGSVIDEIISKGFCKVSCLSQHEYEGLSSLIHRQLVDVLESSFYPNDLIDIAKSLPLSEYHTYAARVDHSKLWTRKARTFSRKSAKLFEDYSLFKRLKSLFGEFCISDEDSIDYPNFVWRLVRPGGTNTDIGPAHRDSWFWDLNPSFPRPQYPFERLKVWIPVVTENDRSGLAIEPFSHLREDITYSSKIENSITKPLISPNSKVTLDLLNTVPGDVIIFHDQLVHSGYSSAPQKTRVSMEFTLFIRRSHSINQG